MALKENYKDDILDVSQNVKRKYQMENNGDGTVSFTDVTEYTQQGDSFGASDMNAVNSEVNEVVNNLGAKNMLPNNATTRTINGITFTVNSDGSVTVNGTASSLASLFLIGSTSAWGSNQYKNCILSGCPSGGSGDSYRIVMQTSSDGSATSKTYLEDGNGVLIDDDNQYCKIYIRIAGGYTANNLIFKPMIRPSRINDDTYVPYAQTNKELTDNLNGFKFYPTGTQLVAYIEGHGWYNTDGKYVIWGTATANALVEASPNTYYGRPSEEDLRGEVGADTAVPFSGGKTNYTLIENGGNYLPYGAVWTRITSYESNKNYLIILTMINSGGDGIASFEIENGNVYLLHSTSSYINDSNRLALRINDGYIEAINNGNTTACKLNYIIWEVSTNYTLIENGGNYLPYGAVWTRITRFKERKNYLVGMKIVAGSSGIASFEIKNGNVQLKHSTSSYINDSNYLSLRVNGDYIEARNCTNSGSGILNYVIWEINA